MTFNDYYNKMLELSMTNGDLYESMKNDFIKEKLNNDHKFTKFLDEYIYLEQSNSIDHEFLVDSNIEIIDKEGKLNDDNVNIIIKGLLNGIENEIKYIEKNFITQKTFQNSVDNFLNRLKGFKEIIEENIIKNKNIKKNTEVKGELKTLIKMMDETEDKLLKIKKADIKNKNLLNKLYKIEETYEKLETTDPDASKELYNMYTKEFKEKIKLPLFEGKNYTNEDLLKSEIEEIENFINSIKNRIGVKINFEQNNSNNLTTKY